MRSLTLLLLILVFSGGCIQGDQTITPGSHDDAGRAVNLPENPSRIIPLAPNLTEILAAIGAYDRIAAVSPSDDFPVGVDSLPQVSTYPIDFEIMVALEPDLIIANSAINSPDDADVLTSLGIPVYFFSFTTLSDIPRVTRFLGDILDLADSAEAVATDFEQGIQDIHLQMDEAEHPPSVLLLIGSEVLYAFGEASYTQEMISIAGGRSLTADFPGEGVILSEEFVLETQPDIIIGAWEDDFTAERLLRLHPTWRDIPAMRNGHVFSIRPDLIHRPGPRLIEGLQEINRAVILAHRGAVLTQAPTHYLTPAPVLP